MRTFFILTSLVCGAVASAADYSYDVNVSGNGGAYAVAAGTSKLVAEDCTYDNLYAAGEYVGGAIYVGENATLELQGTHIFTNNAQYAWADRGSWYGVFNDVYLENGATLILNAQESQDVISLGSGLYSAEEADTTVVKRGEGKLVFGEIGDNSCMWTALKVEAGAVEMRGSVNTASVRIEAGASVSINPPAEEVVISLAVGTAFAEEISFSANGSEMLLSGLEVTNSSISSVGSGKGCIDGATLYVYAEDPVSVDNVILADTYMFADSSMSLSNISMDAYSRIESAAQTFLSGNNDIALAGLVSTQLSGVTLTDGTSLTLTLSADLLEGLVQDDFLIVLEDTMLDAAAAVTLNIQMEEGVSSTFTLSGYSQESNGLNIKLSSAPSVPEPATATLSLLALAALAARRRRAV